MLYRLAVSLTRKQKSGVLFGLDLILIAMSHLCAVFLLVGPGDAAHPIGATLISLGVMLVVGGALISILGLHRIKLKTYQMQGVPETVLVALLICLAGALSTLLLPPPSLPGPLFIVSGMLFLVLSVSSRMLLRRALIFISAKGNPREPILIFGAGQTGQQLAAALAVDGKVEPVAFLDEDRRLQGLTIAGLRVHCANDLERLVALQGIKRIVLAMPNVGHTAQVAMARRLAATGCEIHTMPSFAELFGSRSDPLGPAQPVDMQDLLGRDRLEQALPGVFESYRDHCVMVTGAGGSIGSELCRQVITCGPRRLVLLDHSELALFDIHRELETLAPELEIVPVLGSMTEPGLVRDALERNAVSVVLHAAAYKHVPLVQNNALEGVRNNVFGTRVVASEAMRLGIDRFILISSDKAVRPSSTMGASKRFAELVIQDLATRSQTTRFSMVRFGNVLGSSGSVIPLFREQIARGGPVTLTDAGVTRYFMTISEAVSLVLLAGSFARGGDVFVLDMGAAVPIRDLAHKMIEHAGLSVRDADNPEGDIEIAITGLRPGEKLHEELLIGADMLTTPHPKILRAQEKHLSEIEIANALNALRQAVDMRNVDLLSATLAQWIEPQGSSAGDAIRINE
ncbi:MAG: nucleoside-diphosphate sugar epimerase/dehydratase [Pseudomonadota bacterium]